MENNIPVTPEQPALKHYTGGALPENISYQFNNPDVKTTNDFINPFNDVNIPDVTKPSGPEKDPVNSILENLAAKPASIETKSANSNFDWDKTRADRYVNSTYYKELGFDPNADNETKYGERQTWGDAISQAVAGGAKLAGQSFMQGWEGWGNLANALFNWNSNKSFEERLLGTPDELEAQNKKQEEVMNKYAIFQTPEDENGVFNKHFIGNMLQQGGFAVGAVAQFMSEEFLTAGIASGFSGADLGVAMTKFSGKAITSSEAMADAVKTGAETYKDESIVEGLVNSAKKLIPLSDTASSMIKASKAGAGAMQMANIGLGGVKRALAEANMAFTQGRMLAAGTYGDLYGKLKQEYIDKTGQEPIGNDLDKIKSTAEAAASNDFLVNSGIQLVTNRLQFGNLFDKFGYERQVAKDAAKSFGKDLLEVSGKMVGDETGNITKKVYQKGFMGALGMFGDVAKDYGTKQAAWEISKDIGKGMFKWETAGGIHMLMQDVTNKSLQDYYYDLYHGDKGLSFGKSLETAASSETSMQGVQSFLMGALTGRLLSPFNKGMERLAEGVQTRLGPQQTEIGEDGKTRILSAKEVKEKIQADKQQAIDAMNKFYADPGNALKENIKSFKVQSGAAEKMNGAAELADKYYYNNTKDSTLAEAVAAAKKTNMFDSLLDTVKNYGDVLSDPKQFKEAFGLNPEDHEIPDIRGFFETVAGKIKEHGKLYDRLIDKYSDLVQPELYKEGSEGRQDALFAQKALFDSIEMLATNKFKGEQALVRLTRISSDLAKNPTIGQASVRSVDTLGSEYHTKTEIALLKQEIASMKLNPKMDYQARKDLAMHEKQLDALTRWQDGLQAFRDLPRAKKKEANTASKAYRDYLLSVQEQDGKSPHVSLDDVKEGFHSLVDHFQLNKDYGDYIEAFNTLADPSYFKMMNGKMIDAMKVASDRIKQDAFEKAGFTQEQEQPVDNTSATGGPVATASQGTAEDMNKELRAGYQEYAEDKAGDGESPMSYASWLKFSGAKAIKDKYPHLKDGDVSNTKPTTVTVPAPVPVTEDREHKNFVQNGDITNPHNITQTVLDQGNRTNGINTQVIEKNPEIYSNKKQINPAHSIGTKSDNYEWNQVTDQRERSGSNADYSQVLGTTKITSGTPLHFRTETDTKDFNEYNYLENEKFIKRGKADYFNDDNQVHEHMVNDFPIGIYTTIDGKEVKLGNVRTVKWLEQKGKDGQSSLNVAEEAPGLENNVQRNIDELVDFRKKFYDLHNKNTTFVWHGNVSHKSEGTVRITKNNEKRKLQDVFHPDTKLAIIKNSDIYLDKSTQLGLPKEQLISKFDFDGKDGWPVAIVDTPTGRKLVTYLDVPKLAQQHKDLIIAGWKAFHELNDLYQGKQTFDTESQSYKLANAIYKAYGSELGKDESPSFKMLQQYIDDHITHLSSDAYDTAKEGKSAFNMTQDGKLFSWAIDKGQKERSKDTDQLVLDHPDKLSPEKELKLNELLSKLYYTVKLSGEENKGLNSKEQQEYLSIKDGKLDLSKPGTYNEYMFGILESNLEKGIPVDPHDPKSQWNHFANPVVEYDLAEPKAPAADLDGNTAAPVSEIGGKRYKDMNVRYSNLSPEVKKMVDDNNITPEELKNIPISTKANRLVEKDIQNFLDRRAGIDTGKPATYEEKAKDTAQKLFGQDDKSETDNGEKAKVAEIIANRSQSFKDIINQYTGGNQYFPINASGAEVAGNLKAGKITPEEVFEHRLSVRGKLGAWFERGYEAMTGKTYAETEKEIQNSTPSIMDLARAAKPEDDLASLLAMDFGDTPKDLGYNIDDLPQLDPEDYKSLRTLADKIIKEDPNTNRNCQ